MAEKRFQYGHSKVYGWCVYDAELGMMPAYQACCDLLPRVADDMAESPTMLRSEYAAMRLCARLNNALKRRNRDV